ncbi:type VI secretion system protein TssA [Pelagibius sp. Alg239-R121]|uniref:type VI secretion system protein TssA n=1 Tax=Pelagibius sp. Alg239-R121 TaxID=2993448 RepID=UPI0024A62108|nr:type VI secretion system protein TssA [Pelagibius sp. Alg239-R121]
MASQENLDFEALLAPIEGENSAGENLRDDASPTSVYYQIKDARSAARAAERNMEMDEEPSGFLDEWRSILELSPDVIATRSKDLELASWLTEALLRANGFGGLRDGFRLIHGMIENFWDDLYPLEDEDGVETKVAPLTGLNGDGGDGTLIQPIRKVLITQGSSDEPYAYWQYEQAGELAKVADEEKRQARIAAGALTMEQMTRAVSETPAAFYSELVDDLKAALEEFAKVNALLDEKCGMDSPPASNIRNLLQAILDEVGFLAKDKLVVDAPAAEDGEGAEAGNAAEGGGQAGAGPAVAGVIANREDAFNTLLKVADYFRKTEPHSTMSYTLEELVRRARMPLSDLLVELIPDAEARRGFLMRAGIAPPAEDGY